MVEVSDEGSVGASLVGELEGAVSSASGTVKVTTGVTTLACFARLAFRVDEEKTPRPVPRPRPLPRIVVESTVGTIDSESGGGTDPPRNLLLDLRIISLKLSVFVAFFPLLDIFFIVDNEYEEFILRLLW